MIRYGIIRAVARSENQGGGLVLLGGDNVSPPPGWDRVNWSDKKSKSQKDKKTKVKKDKK